MARKKQFIIPFKPRSDKDVYAFFISSLLDGLIQAERLTESRDKLGRIVMEYEEKEKDIDQRSKKS